MLLLQSEERCIKEHQYLDIKYIRIIDFGIESIQY